MVRILSTSGRLSGIERRKSRLARRDRLDDGRAPSARRPRRPRPSARSTTRLDAQGAAARDDRRELGFGVGAETIDARPPPARRICCTFSMWRARLAMPRVTAAASSSAEIAARHAAVHFECAHGGDDHARHRGGARLAALDVEEFLGAQVGAEPGLGHDVIGELQRKPSSPSPSCSHARCWRTGRHGRRPGLSSSVCTRLGLQRVPQQRRHRAVAPSGLARGDRACRRASSPRRCWPSRSCRSSVRSRARQKIAITSEATVMSKPSSRGEPLATPPSAMTICAARDRSCRGSAAR